MTKVQVTRQKEKGRDSLAGNVFPSYFYLLF